MAVEKKSIIPSTFRIGAGGIATLSGPAADKDQLEQLIGTRVGELRWKPTFGTRIDQYRGLPASVVPGLVRAEVIAATERWLPKLAILEVQTEVVDSELRILVSYRSRETGRTGELLVTL